MPRDPSELEGLISHAFPITFGYAQEVDEDDYIAKRNAVTDYATAVTGPFLSTETVRYQSMLLYLSFIYLSIKLFNLGHFKLSGDSIIIDKHFLILCAILMVMITTLFLFKSYVDYLRTRFVREKNDHVISDLTKLISIGQLRGRIQFYFWQRLFYGIGEKYKSVIAAHAKALDEEPDIEDRQLDSSYDIDLDSLREIPELLEEIKLREGFLTSFIAEVTHDEGRFRDKVDTIFFKFRPCADLVFQQDNRWNQVQEVYKECLAPWFDARNKLANRVIDEKGGSLPLHRSKALVSALKRVRRIRVAYSIMEVVMPVLFTAIAILYAYLL